MKSRMLGFALAAALLSSAAAGCINIPEEPAPTMGYELEIRPVVEKADPEVAIRKIYASLEESSTENLDMKAVEEIVGIKAGDVTECHVYYSDAKSGLADVMLVKPASGDRDQVRESLYVYKERRIKEFENYDILNAYAIAQNALIYDQGEYVILLMMDDNEAAKAIIDEYIPQ